MKKILIVNNNMKVGGVQKSLYNLLWTFEGKYDITLYLFAKTGAYLDQLPPSVKVEYCRGPFRYFGISQGECRGIQKLIRGVFATVCRLFGRSMAVRLMLPGQKRLPEHYDCAISYLHNGGERSFYGGVQEFVIHRVDADRKIAFLHCDYESCGGHNKANDRLIGRFDKIAACSDGCKRRFLEALPQMEEKCVIVRNCHRFDQIRAMADDAPVQYDPRCKHVIMVGRLAHEKAVDRGIRACAYAIAKGLPVTLHLVGGGPMEQSLRSLAQELGIEASVVFHGEQQDPYRYMKNADLFLLTSYHEAAPMVIDEAHCLGLPVLTVQTTSSHEMVTERRGGWVCENAQAAIDEALARSLSDPAQIQMMRAGMRSLTVDNGAAMERFTEMIEG